MCPKLLTTRWFGTFILEDENVIDKVLFPKEGEGIAKRLLAISNDKVLKEEKELVQKHSPQATTEQRLVNLGMELIRMDVELTPDQFDFPQDLLAEATRLKAGMAIKESTSQDLFIVQALESYDTLLEVRNLMLERLRNYYSLHWPELIDRYPEHKYIKLIAKYGDRKAIGLSGEKNLPKQELGADIPKGDIRVVKEIATLLEEIDLHVERIENHIDQSMTAVAPNLNSLTGALIGARLIALAGSLQKLSKLPSSTVQILGAEKAMFRSKTEKTRKPKHGVIFMHPMIRSAPHWRRGNIARALAGKASIAAKVDFFEGEFIGDSLHKELEKKVEDITRRYPEAPKKRKK
jgi:nucleolar protein 56